ncbi:MAG: M20/M25/M40 family metallo-hydrolase, partial [Methanobacteriota archaeon]
MADAQQRRKVYAVLDGRADEFVRILSDYARVATISAHRTQFEEGAAATRDLLEGVGAEVRLLSEADGPACVVGEIVDDPSLPWIILYNHYDVQPVDPLEEWKSDPFVPEVRDGKLFARGVADTKGNVVAQALAVQAVREVLGALPVNVRFFVDGEEE